MSKPGIQKPSDILIIGGGIIGMLTARELALAGATVTLLDRQQAGQESSWAGGGIISPLYPWRYPEAVTQLATWSQAHYQRLCAELLEQTGIDPEWTLSGLLIASPSEQATATRWGAQHEQTIELVDSKSLSQLEPAWQTSHAEAIWMQSVAQVRNPRLVKALKAEMMRLGITLIEDTPVRHVTIQNDRFRRVETDRGSYSANALIVCAGAWSGELLRSLSPTLDIQPVRGQMILFNTKPGAVTRIVLESDRYIIPRRDGRILFGSTVEYDGFIKKTSPEALDELHSIALDRFPVLRQAPIERHWAGLRPGSPQGIPYIGPHPEIEGLFTNTGHFRNGVVLGPASARLMADIILKRETILPADAYALDANRN